MSYDSYAKSIDIWKQLCYIITVWRGGDCIYALVLLILSIFLSYNIISIYNINIKSKLISSKKFLSPIKFKPKFHKNNFNKYKAILNNLENPYGLNFKRYKTLKYFISPFVFILIFFRSYNIILSLIIFLFFFYLPNLLIKVYMKNESLKIINDISEVTSSLKLALSCNIPLHESLKYVTNNIDYKRFREKFDLFINDYLMYNFNMIKAVDNFSLKFSSYEFNMFLNIILQGEKEGKMIESLTIFSETLDLSYFKYLKYNETRRILFVTMASILSLINITIMAIYPIIMQISENLQNVFS